MTVIAWDGLILAADKQATYGDHRKMSTKIFCVDNGSVIAVCGAVAKGLKIVEWFKSGCKRDDWPDTIQESDGWAQLIVASTDGVYWYDRLPYPIPLEQPFMAWGNGDEFAMGALAMGATAIEAVEIASKYCEGCGMGVDYFKVR